MNPRFTVEVVNAEYHTHAVHDNDIDEPVAWTMTEHDAQMIVAAMNKEYASEKEDT